jgi:hypothetical protein
VVLEYIYLKTRDILIIRHISKKSCWLAVMLVVSLFAKAQNCAILTSPSILPVEDQLTWTDEGVAGGYILTLTDEVPIPQKNTSSPEGKTSEDDDDDDKGPIALF